MNFRAPKIAFALSLLAFLLGCSSESDFKDTSMKERLFESSEFHPKDARLTKPEAIRLAAQALVKEGFRPDDFNNPGANYIGPTRGMFGIKHDDWIVSFTNKTASASRYPTLSVYVDDRTGKTEIVEKEAHP